MFVATRLERRGVSPVIAVLLLIVIAVLASLIVYFWVSGYMGSLKASTTEHTTTFGEKIRIVGVTKAYEDATWISYEVWLSNIGERRVYLDYVYVLDTATGSVVWRYFAGNWYLDPGSSQYIWLAIPKSMLVDGRDYVIMVVTKGGFTAKYRFTVRFSV